MAYLTINAIFDRHGAEQTAAEAHGVAVGMLCVDSRAKDQAWAHELFRDVSILTDGDRNALRQLFEETRQLLNPPDEQFAFDLLLPGDDAALFERVEALREWCEGFLFGIGYGGSGADWPGECGEILRDVVEFTKMESEAGGEEDENAFMEIHEYLRSAVMLVRDRLTDAGKNRRTH